jgi:hypothetical protein
MASPCCKAGTKFPSPYYAFFPWAFQDYAENEKDQRGDRGSVGGVLSREKAMVLGAVLHHDRAACDGGALGGSEKAIELLNRQARSSYNRRRLDDNGCGVAVTAIVDEITAENDDSYRTGNGP